MRFVDLSAPILNSPPAVPPYLRTEIAFSSHAEGAAQAQAILKVPPSVFRHGEGWATETITRLGTHDSTHVDAPFHYNRLIQGKPAATVDQLPLEWFFSDGVVLDMRHKPEGEPMTVADAQAALAALNYTLKPLDIVLVRTGCDQYYSQPDYIFRGCGVTAEATHWLFEQGIRLAGIDAWGWDKPLDRQAREAMASGREGVFWAAHQVDLPYAHMERLVGLGELPPHGFKVSCFPLKIAGASAGPARVVAMVP